MIDIAALLDHSCSLIGEAAASVSALSLFTSVQVKCISDLM